MNLSTTALGWLTLAIYLFGLATFVIITQRELSTVKNHDDDNARRYEHELRTDLRYTLIWPIRTVYIISHH